MIKFFYNLRLGEAILGSAPRPEHQEKRWQIWVHENNSNNNTKHYCMAQETIIKRNKKDSNRVEEQVTEIGR